MADGTILVTGATGRVGKELVEQLLSGEARVRVLVRDKQKVAYLGNRVEITVGDLDKPETLAEAMRSIEKLYFITYHTQQVANLVEAAKKAGVRHIVKQSSTEAERSIGLGKWHREQEEFIKGSGMAWTIIRPSMFMTQTIKWWAATIKSRSAVFFPGGKGKVRAIDPRDVAAMACTVLTQPGHEGSTYAVTGPESLTIADLVEIIGKVLGRRIRYIAIPPALAGIWLRRNGLPRELVKALVQTLDALRKNEYAVVTEDVERVTGHKPRGFEAWCRENVAAFQ
jgi:uncharacterized protein YbjT (DUF2867 family)